MFNVTMNNIADQRGAARTTMCVLLTGAAFNMVLDPVFIYVLKLGVAGAAIATAISQAVSTLILSVLCYQRKEHVQLSFQELLFFQ